MKIFQRLARQIILAALALPLAAHATMVSPSETVVPNVMYFGELQVPGSFVFGHSFLPSTGNLVGSPSGSHAFTDEWHFTVAAPATINAWVSSLGLYNALGISNLKIRLFDREIDDVIEDWAESTNTQIGAHTMSVAALPAYEHLHAHYPYSIQIAGIVSGNTGGGSYSAGLNLIATPVPLPATLLLFLSGLLPMSWLGRQRRRAGQAKSNLSLFATRGALA
jgi:hypothetical protein